MNNNVLTEHRSKKEAQGQWKEETISFSTKILSSHIGMELGEPESG